MGLMSSMKTSQNDAQTNADSQTMIQTTNTNDFVERDMFQKTFLAPRAMTLSQFKTCLMKKRVHELNELLREEEARETTTTIDEDKGKKKSEEEEEEEERRNLEIEKHALERVLAGAKEQFEADRMAEKHTDAMQKVRQAKQEAIHAEEKVLRLSEELKEKEREFAKQHEDEREKRSESRKMDANARDERKIVVEAELSRRENERHKLVTNLKATIAEEAEIRKKIKP